VAEVGQRRGVIRLLSREIAHLGLVALDKRAAPDKTTGMTPAFDRFVAPARRRPQLWRFLAGMLLAVAIYTAWVVGVLALAYLLFAPDVDPILWTNALVAAETPLGTLLLLLTFVGMALGPMAAARWLHGRTAGSLFGPRARTLHDFVVAAGIVFVVLGLSVGLWTLRFDAVPNLPVSTWAMVLPLTLLGLLVQTGAEEILFRGYMQSQLAARFRSPLVWLVLPSLLFGVVHYDPVSASGNAWLIVGAAATFGVVAADLTARTGSIGAAWGFHFANNTLAIARMNWISNYVRPKINSLFSRREVPENLWTKCPNAGPCCSTANCRTT
jgi:uncharacterized protein